MILLLNIGAITWMAVSDVVAPRIKEMKLENWQEPQIYALLSIAVCVVADLTALLGAKVYRAVVMDIATEAERQPGMAGVRAWLSINHVIAVAVLALAASLGFDYSFLGVVLLGLCVLLAYPVIRTQVQPGAPRNLSQPPAEERQRVLALVEAGKITAEEGAELLTALAQSQAASGEGVSVSGPRRIMALGAAAMLVAFFLPWFTENITQALSDVANQMQQALPLPPGVSPMPGGVSAPVQNVMQIILRGGDVRSGLGWIALAAAVGAAVLPFFWTGRRDERLMRNITLAMLAVGSIAMLYLLSNSFNAITTIEPGFWLGLAAFAALWIGATREYVGERAQLQAVGIGA